MLLHIEMDCFISWRNSINVVGILAIFAEKSRKIYTYEWSMKCYFLKILLEFNTLLLLFPPLCFCIRELNSPRGWQIVYVAFNNREGGSIGQEWQWADWLHGILQVGKLPWCFLLALIFSSADTSDALKVALLTSSATGVKEHSQSSHAKKEENLISMPKRLSSCQRYSFNTHSWSMATWRCCLKK